MGKKSFTIPECRSDRWGKTTLHRFSMQSQARGKIVLVAGGAGFLGGHLCDRLIQSNHSVVCLDNFSTGRMSNVAHLVGHPLFKLITNDIVNPLPDLGQINQIYNLACPASPIKYQMDPVQTFKTNVCGVMNLLDLAERTGARILQASTSEVYGDPTISPQPELYRGNVNTTGPRACYDEGKRAAETLFYDYHTQKGVSIRIARIFNTFGPRMSPDDGRVISTFVMQALSGRDLTIFGDGRQTRSFCFVSDMIDGLIALMASSDRASGPINLGNPEELSILQVARTVLSTLGSSSRLKFVELPVDDPKQRKPDIREAKRLLSWEPRVYFSEGLRKTIPYFGSHAKRLQKQTLVAE